MENYDERRRHSNQNERYRARPGYEDRGGGRESWREWSQEDQRPSRRERGWLDYDTNYGRGDERRYGREEQRYGESHEERPRFSPDWSRDDEQPRYSDEPYYARNREYGRSGDSRNESDDRRRWQERSRGSIPRAQHELAERSEPGDYYDPDWPYQRGPRERGREGRSAGRDTERSGESESQRYYHGYYRSSGAPFSYPGGSGYLYSESWALHGPHTGRGPKGYKRSDQQICEEACQRLERDGEIDASEIEVSAEDGVIHLRGTVPDRGMKRRAEECVESIYGARDVMNELRVQPSRGEPWQSGASRETGEARQSGESRQGMQSSASQAGRASQPGQMSTGGQTSPQTSPGSQPTQKH